MIMTTQKQWTPGPWYVAGEDAIDDVPFIEIMAGTFPGPTCRQICDVRSELNEETDDFVLDDAAHANANLIAAAPAMYEALEKIAQARDYHAEHGIYPKNTVDADQEFDDWAADIASTALASARGEK